MANETTMLAGRFYREARAEADSRFTAGTESLYNCYTCGALVFWDDRQKHHE